MEYRKLREQEICSVYEQYLIADFDELERKPLSLILQSVRSGAYEGYVFSESDEWQSDFMGYVFLSIHGDNRILDYFAVKEGRRNDGIGSEILKILPQLCPPNGSILVEVEDAEAMEDARSAALAERRYGFYLRNGYEDTGIKVYLWDVQYRILSHESSVKLKREERIEEYLAFHKAMMPPDLYREKVRIL